MLRSDYGPEPFVADAKQLAVQNSNYRVAVWTGCYLQMTVMSIPPCGEIGLEIHEDTDQLIRIEQGRAIVKMGICRHRLSIQQCMCEGDIVIVPAGTWHNVVNAGQQPLKLSSVYAPPKHPRGTVQKDKESAENEKYE